jgi:hypothetical protein
MSMHSLNECGLSRIVAKGIANTLDALRYRGIADNGFPPNRFAEFLFCHEFIGMLREVTQYLERSFLEPYLLLSLPEDMRHGVKPEWSETRRSVRLWHGIS